MGISLKNFFNNSSNSLPVKEPEKPVEQPQLKKALLRGSGGKFISKLPTVVSEPKIKNPTVETIPENATPQLSVFYGQTIRKFYLDDTWFFSILDILTLAKIINPAVYVNEIEQNPEQKKFYSQIIKIIICAKEDGTKENLECVAYDGFIQLLPIMRSKETMFPGPFPEWLQEVSKTPNQ